MGYKYSIVCIFLFIVIHFFISNKWPIWLSSGITQQRARWNFLMKFWQLYLYIYWAKATVYYFDNISFLEHVSNQFFLPNESSISQASYRLMVLTICFQRSGNKPFYGGGVVEKKWNAWWCTSIRRVTCISCSVKDVLNTEISSGIFTFLSDKMFYKCSSLI